VTGTPETAAVITTTGTKTGLGVIGTELNDTLAYGTRDHTGIKRPKPSALSTRPGFLSRPAPHF
jgi:hypothetical protein